MSLIHNNSNIFFKLILERNIGKIIKEDDDKLEIELDYWIHIEIYKKDKKASIYTVVEEGYCDITREFFKLLHIFA